MVNRPRQKGTMAETDLRKRLNIDGLVRAPASAEVDLIREGYLPPIQVLATRPDRGEWLITMDLETFIGLMEYADDTPYLRRIEIEVKRHARLSIHTLFASKFRRKR